MVRQASLPAGGGGEAWKESALATLRSRNVHSGSVKTILICEDDQALRTLIRVVLGDGYRFVEAHDGEEALEFALRLKPDLIILDLMLPGRSGFEVLYQLRKYVPATETPVIVMSAWGHAERAALNAGADRFVPKPFDADDFAAAVREVLDAA
jgi:DNA-binding response OmpR family regulator